MTTRIKFCGITRAEDAERAVALGAWAIGLVHYPESPRYVEPDLAAQLASEFRRRIEVVGLFVNAGLDEVARAAENSPLTMIQLHGDEGPAYCTEIKRRTGLPVIKAIRVESASEVVGAEAFRTDYHLFDKRSPKEHVYGGSGESFDWQILRRRKWSDVPTILAGGLDANNVGEAIAEVKPFAVDISSGVEDSPGIKNHDEMSWFATAVATASPPEPDAEPPDRQPMVDSGTAEPAQVSE